MRFYPRITHPFFTTLMFGLTFGITTELAAPVRANPAPVERTQAIAEAGTEATNIEAIAAHLTGIMDTSAQANADPDFVSVRMTTCRVQVSETADGTADGTAGNSVYLYQEQALSANLAEPYRQRFLQIVAGEVPDERLGHLTHHGQRIHSNTFKPAEPENWTGLCDTADAQPVPTTAIGELVCTVALRPSSLGFVGSTQSGGCPTNIRGAVSISNVVVLHENGMDTWDRGFDANGNQLWGAEDAPYQYRWIDRVE